MQSHSIEIDGWSPNLSWGMNTINSYTWTFTIDKPSILKISGHIDCHHRGIYNTGDRPVMVAFRILLNGRFLKGSRMGTNIAGEKQHYVIIPVHGFKKLDPGTYTIEIQGRSASSAAPNKNGLAEIKGGYNQVVYEIIDDPSEVVEDVPEAC